MLTIIIIISIITIIIIIMICVITVIIIISVIHSFIHGAAIGARPVRRRQRVSLAREIRNLPQRQTGPHARPRDQSQPQSHNNNQHNSITI